MTRLDWPPDEPIDARESYERYADIYDDLFDGLDADAAFYLSAAAAPDIASGPILEIGIGTGRLTTRLLAAGHHVVGVDASSHMLARAVVRFGTDPRLQLVLGDVRALDLGGRAFSLAIAPFGMVAHLLTDDDRLAAFRSIYAHLAPGGTFIFDDAPSWLAAPDDGTTLHMLRSHDDANGGSVRLLTNTIAAADAPLGVRYDFIDWLDAAGRVTQRKIVRIVFRNIALADELALLARAGFARVELFGGFDRRPLDVDAPGTDARLVLCCHRDR